MEPEQQHNSHGAILLIALTFVLLMILSAVPWSRLTNGVVKDFNLFSDIYHNNTEQIENVNPVTEIDPELTAAIVEHTDSTATVAIIESEAVEEIKPVVATTAPTAGDTVCLEDYTPGGRGTERLRDLLNQASGRVVRIAVLGDSFIEGDIFSEEIRNSLREYYGGQGVGYMSAHTEFPGFRNSVSQSDKGWTAHDIRHIGARDTLRTLPGEYYTAEEGARSTYTGTAHGRGLDRWSRNAIAFTAPAPGSVTLSVGDSSVTTAVCPGPEVQTLRMDLPGDRFSVSTTVPGLKLIGVWMDGERGVAVDCMSLRGNSGASHRKLNPAVARALDGIAPYDIIILEYGMNALSAEQKDYRTYGIVMERVIDEIRRNYPQAEIIMTGVADRGSRNGSAVASMPTVTAMVNAQRAAAHNAGVIFWDTRAAMGGENSVVEWRKKGWVNADYVHLNHKGGKELGQRFVKSILHSVR